MTDHDLKLDLAKMLPEQFSIIGNSVTWSRVATVCDQLRKGCYIIDTEWLHVCWLVEEKIVGTDLWGRYLVAMETTPWNESVHATWQQRAAALIKVKGQK